ncbi:MAG: metallophosphoesterase family protein [Jiangellaceae bacterium]
MIGPRRHGRSLQADQALTGSAVPVWSAPGNHDLAGRTSGGPHRESGFPGRYRDVDDYRQAVGPEWYSFQYGPHHFVVLENYRGLGESDQLRWLQQDLALNAAGKQVVVITHVPWNVPQTAAEHTAAYLELLGRHDVRLLLAGHTHSNDVVSGVVGRAVQAVTTSAVSTLDQTPRGFRLVEFRDGGVELPYGELDADREPAVVHPVGAVGIARQPTTVQISRYHPPGVAAEVEYRYPRTPGSRCGRWAPRSWTADLDDSWLEPVGPRRRASAGKRRGRCSIGTRATRGTVPMPSPRRCAWPGSGTRAARS